MTKDRSDAAKKAWVTRRANARKAEYRQRGLKAAATRKARQSSEPTGTSADREGTHSSRSEAAHKAWATRRARRGEAPEKAPDSSRSDAARKAWVTRRANASK